MRVCLFVCEVNRRPRRTKRNVIASVILVNVAVIVALTVVVVVLAVYVSYLMFLLFLLLFLLTLLADAESCWLLLMTACLGQSVCDLQTEIKDACADELSKAAASSRPNGLAQPACQWFLVMKG